jgi:hypothetical protein
METLLRSLCNTELWWLNLTLITCVFPPHILITCVCSIFISIHFFFSTQCLQNVNLESKFHQHCLLSQLYQSTWCDTIWTALWGIIYACLHTIFLGCRAGRFLMALSIGIMSYETVFVSWSSPRVQVQLAYFLLIGSLFILYMCFPDFACICMRMHSRKKVYNISTAWCTMRNIFF